MNYVFTTIAIGQQYLKSACEFAIDLNKISKSHKVLIVTDCVHSEIDNVLFVKFDEANTTIIHNWFNFNLKYIPILEAYKLNFNYIIFFDADWQIYNYSESLLISFLESLNHSNLDFIYERPHRIGSGKMDNQQCFWRHKIEPYKLMETNFYDNGQVVNEQFMIFKKNEKLEIFLNKWKERNEFGIKNNIWAFAEGLEIGMSAVDAQMNMDWKRMFELKNFFKFVSKSGDIHTRF